MDIAKAEMVEAELTRLIEKRSRKGEADPDEREELWKASVAAYHEERRLQARAEWHAYHCGQVDRMRRTLEALIAHHEEQATRLLEDDSER